jgi:hypothetical protein
MKAFVCALVLAAAAASSGCGATHLRIVGYPEADIYVTNPPGSKEFTFVGRTQQTSKEFVLDYVLPKALENAKVGLLIKSPQGSWTDAVFTDRDTTVYYPPEGVPSRPKATSTGQAASAARPASAPKPATAPTSTDPAPAPAPAPTSGEQPSASVSPN